MDRTEPSSHRAPAALMLALLTMLALTVITPVAQSVTAATAAAATLGSQNGGPNYNVNTNVDPFGDDYPATLKNATQDSVVDPWRFYNRECTSFVAWRLNVQLDAGNYPGGPWKFSNFMTSSGVPGTGSGSVQFGNAGTWDAAATSLGYVVNTTPALGSVAQWHGGETSYNWSGSALGHVGIVVAIAGDGTITMASYNASVRGGYDLVSNIKAPRYLHIADLDGDPRITSFVDAAFTDFLNRPPTEAEIRRFSAAIEQQTMSYADVAAQLATSTEWVGNLVDGFYRSMFNRTPDPSGAQYWTNRLVSGTPVPNVVASLYASTEYYSRTGGTPQGFVSALYTAILNRPADNGGLAYWAAQISRLGRSGVALALYQSPESRATRVTALYAHLLGRAPDPGGLSYWAGQILTRGDLALAASLASSTEYLHRALARFPGPVTQG